MSPSTGTYCSFKSNRNGRGNGNGNCNCNGNGNCNCNGNGNGNGNGRCTELTATVAARNVNGNRNCRYAERQGKPQLSLRVQLRTQRPWQREPLKNKGPHSPECSPPLSIPKLPSFLLQQILHIIRMFLFLRHDLHQHVLGRRIGIANTLDHLPIRLDSDAFLDQVGLDHRPDIA